MPSSADVYIPQLHMLAEWRWDNRHLLPADDPIEVFCDKVAAEFLVQVLPAKMGSNAGLQVPEQDVQGKSHCDCQKGVGFGTD